MKKICKIREILLWGYSYLQIFFKKKMQLKITFFKWLQHKLSYADLNELQGIKKGFCIS